MWALRNKIQLQILHLARRASENDHQPFPKLQNNKRHAFLECDFINFIIYGFWKQDRIAEGGKLTRFKHVVESSSNATSKNLWCFRGFLRLCSWIELSLIQRDPFPNQVFFCAFLVNQSGLGAQFRRYKTISSLLSVCSQCARFAIEITRAS